MLLKSWSHTFHAQRIELKIASILALVTACLVMFIVLWSFFTSETPVNNHISSPNATVQTIETPAQLREPQHTPLHEKQVNSPAKQQSEKTPPSAKVYKTQPQQKIVKLVLGKGNYYVQVGAFSQAKLARLMLEKMKQKYKYAKIKPKSNSHAVWVGPVMRKQDAQTLKKHLLRKSNIQGFITIEK
ncbi:MAG TPA: hypothetical protein EYP39_03315 [Ghiorsea sp.]|nr:hypothetical protein [Ghiorsea sp.]